MGAEKRRSKRIPITMHLDVSSLFKQDNVHVKNINAPIEITDINCVVQIVRRKQKDDGTTLYGCEFVGMPSIFDYIFDDIENEYLKNHSDDEKMNN